MDRNWDGKERRADGVSIPYPLLGIMFTLVLQTLGGVWWASAMSAKLGFLNEGQIKLEKTINEATSNRYTVMDASKDFSVYDKRITAIESIVADNKRMITQIQITNGEKSRK